MLPVVLEPNFSLIFSLSTTRKKCQLGREVPSNFGDRRNDRGHYRRTLISTPSACTMRSRALSPLYFYRRIAYPSR